jgi:hypothetical protein
MIIITNFIYLFCYFFVTLVMLMFLPINFGEDDRGRMVDAHQIDNLMGCPLQVLLF